MRSEGDCEFAFTCGADEAQAWPLLLVLLTAAAGFVDRCMGDLSQLLLGLVAAYRRRVVGL